MKSNSKLKIHFVNVNHGDCTIIEFPDYGHPAKARVGIVDFGAQLGDDRKLARDYMQALIKLRQDNDPDFKFRIEFACVTHPHNDHYGGLPYFMDAFANSTNADENYIQMFWDCGFRTQSTLYNRALSEIGQNKNITFIRLSSGLDFTFGHVRVQILTPSIDMRNRFDTWGVGKNNASVILKISYKKSHIILGADAEFATWGKAGEEFPRMQKTQFSKEALGLAERKETTDQLKCHLFKVAHHGSKHGTSLEYLERLNPRNVVIPAGSEQWYSDFVPSWKGMFPHPLVQQIFKTLDPSMKVFLSGEKGNLIFTYSGGTSLSGNAKAFTHRPDEAGLDQVLAQEW